MPKKKNEVVYEVPSDQAIILTEYLFRVWDKLGQPKDPLSIAGQKLVEAIILAYEKTYPREWAQWLEQRKEYQNEELTLHQQISTGRSLASYPMFVYNLLRKMFPDVDFSKRQFVIKFVKLFPMFRVARRI
jgi:hypothetical protein